MRILSRPEEQEKAYALDWKRPSANVRPRPWSRPVLINGPMILKLISRAWSLALTRPSCIMQLQWRGYIKMCDGVYRLRPGISKMDRSYHRCIVCRDSYS